MLLVAEISEKMCILPSWKLMLTNYLWFFYNRNYLLPLKHINLCHMGKGNFTLVPQGCWLDFNCGVINLAVCCHDH
jgi:hypothetical protein